MEARQRVEYHVGHHDPASIQGTLLEEHVTVELVESLSGRNQCDGYIRNMFLDKLAR